MLDLNQPYLRNWPLGRKITAFILVPLVTYLIIQFLLPKDFPPTAIRAFVILCIAVGYWVTDAMPPFAVSMLVIGYSVYFLDDTSFITVSENWQHYAGTWSNSAIWIMMGGLFISLAFQTTQLDGLIANKVLAVVGKNPKTVLLAVMLVTGFLSMLISNTATAALMFAIIHPICISERAHNIGFTKSLVIGVGASASFGGMGTIIGTPVNAMVLQVLKPGETLSFTDWMVIGMPFTIVLLLLSWLTLILFFKPNKEPIQVERLCLTLDPNLKLARTIATITVCVTAALWFTTPLTKLPVAAISFVPMVALTVSGVIRQEHIKLVSWDTLLLVAGGLTLGLIIQENGLMQYVSAKIHLPKNMLLASVLFSMLTLFISNIMSHTATASILIPFAAAVYPSYSLYISIVVALSASMSVLLPISTPPNALALSTGFVHHKDFVVLGVLSAIVGPCMIAILYFLW